MPVLFAACSSTPTQTTAQAPATTHVPTAAPERSATTSTGSAPSSAVTLAHLDPNSPVWRNRSVYFEFDESAMPAKYTSVIEVQGAYLSHNHALHVRVEGNTDERGSSEYNLALGQRRAEAVKSALKLYGVNDAQIEAVSFGKERAKSTGHDESAWAENRRADVVYAAAK
jgi:peptidoglycan-associated lipoprotein